MPFNVLFLPLLGGYIFISKWNRTRFRALRLSGNKLILESAAAGIGFLMVAFTITSLFKYFFPAADAVWSDYIPFDYAGTSLLAFIIGTTAWAPLNRWYKRDAENRRAIEDSNDFLEIMLETALRESKQVSLNLKTGKVYIGFISKMFDPSYERKYITIFPTLSGYRDPTDLSLTITSDYYKVYLRALEEAKIPDEINDFEILIPVSEIQLIKLFDPSAIELFDDSV